jgi:hypothetical protein
MTRLGKGVYVDAKEERLILKAGAQQWPAENGEAPSITGTPQRVRYDTGIDRAAVGTAKDSLGGDGAAL